MLIKQIQFRGIGESGEVFCQPLLGGLEKTAEAQVSRSRLHPAIQDFVRAVKTTPAGIYVLVNALGAGEYWGSNVNGDLFPEKALIHAPDGWEQMSPQQQMQAGKTWEYGFPTFLGAHPYKHHVNKDPSRAFGRVEIATWNPDMHRVELVVYLDRALCKQFDAYDVIERIERGEFPDVSMGCKVPYDVCTICQNQSRTRDDYCEHAKSMMNKILPDGRKVAVSNLTPRFFDISFVFIGADKTAKVMAKLASVGNQQCLGDFCAIPRPSAEVGEVFSKSANGDMLQYFADNPDKLREKKKRDKAKEKTASAKQRLTSALIGAGVGVGAGQVGNHAIGADSGSRKKDAVKDGIAGLLMGGALPFTKKAADEQLARMRHSLSSFMASKGLPEDHPHVVIAGGAMYGHGLRDKFDDIDVVVPGLEGRVEEVHHGIKVDAGPTFKLGDRDMTQEAFEHAHHHESGLSFMSPEHTLEFKQHMNRPKDQADIAKLQQHLGHTKQANDPIKKKLEFQGVPIHLEWLKGETRLYKKGKVVKYKRFMKANYGLIPDTQDADGEEIDVYLGPDKSSPKAWVIKQMKKGSGEFDENKVMIGYPTEAAARASYDYHMGGTKEFFGGIHEVPVSGLRALFSVPEAKESTKTAEESCHTGCHCDPCGGSFDKLAGELFGVTAEKSASHKKLSEIIKSIPAGPFTRETLPRLEKTERDIPEDVLNTMGEMPLGASCSTAGMGGMVLKPREFQRLLLIQMGERPYADELDDKNMTFGHSDEIDDSIPIGEEHVDGRLLELLSRLGMIRDRSAAGSAIARRSNGPARSNGPKPAVSDEPVMKKIAAAYNGYRRSLLKKATAIQEYLTTNPQLSADTFGSSMAQAFAGGVDKVASASVFSPDSLAYLVGAYTERDFHTASKEVVASLALTGAVREAV